MSTSKRRAHHATKACNSCRRRRCKCDGVHPVCGTCAFYGHECTWSQEEDARRPATKQLVESLRVRIRELESEVTQLRGQSSEPTRNSAVPSSGSSEHDAAMLKGDLPFAGRSHLTMQQGNISASGPTSMWSTFPIDENYPQQPQHLDSYAYQFVFNRDPAIPQHLQPRPTQLSDQCEWGRHLCLDRLDPSIGFDRMEHDILLDRCFSFHTVWLRPVEPQHFLHDMLAQLTPGYIAAVPQQARSLCYSPFLHLALMSFATAFSDNPKIRAKQTRLHFAQCAKQLLESECERPTLTVVQAMTFLSDYHGSLGERGLAYMLFGMSCRTVRALGLCIDARPWVESKRITPEELTARDWQFWSTFCQDKIMSLDYGRDYDIPLPHLNVNLPKIDDALDHKPWLGEQHGTLDADKPQPNRGTLVFFESCKLMLLAVRIMDTIYSQGRQNWRVTERDSVSEIHLLLDSWYNSLPEPLVVSSRSSTRPLPHIIVLNLAYWWLLLLLHRPFYARTQRSASNASTESPPTSFTDLSVKLCDRAANKIVQLVMLYDKCYGLRYFPLNMLQVIFMAGATLLVQSATLSESAVKKRAEAHDATRKCIRALQLASQTWECAMLSANQLQRLLHEQTGESPIQPTVQLQTLSAESSPMTYQTTLPAEPPTPTHSTHSELNFPATSGPGPVDGSPPHLMPHVYREFMAQQLEHENLELGYSVPIPSQVHHLQYPGLHQLHQQPLMGMPSGAQFMPNPHVLPLPYDPNFNGGYTMSDHADYFPSRQLQPPDLR